MGIHHTYKSQRGERAAKKQAKQMERQRLSRNRQLLKQQQQNNEDTLILKPGETLTLDMLTAPNGKK